MFIDKLNKIYCPDKLKPLLIDFAKYLDENYNPNIEKDFSQKDILHLTNGDSACALALLSFSEKASITNRVYIVYCVSKGNILAELDSLNDFDFQKTYYCKKHNKLHNYFDFDMKLVFRSKKNVK